MKIQQTLQKSLEDWNRISGLDFCILDENNQIYITTCDKKLPSVEKLTQFREDTALCTSNRSCSLYKLDNGSGNMLLIVWGSGDSASTIGELAVCQIESLLSAYAEKTDKNSFMQNLLLDRYSQVEAFNKAAKLHISPSVRRAVFLVETKQHKDESALATIRNIFSARTRDFITALDDSGIIVVRELQNTESYEELDGIACMLVDMLNTEAMTSAWVSYSNVADDIMELSDAYKEARTALEVGKIFYAEKNVFGYNQLGIGRLIYQLPTQVCDMFVNEIFGDESLESIDDETLNIIRTFFENNLNLSETSRQLYVHRNTLVYRFEKLQKRFGLDVRTFEDALAFKLAMMVSDYITYSRNHGK
ncbi:PucR family transcriptional regulator [Blautia schinkii]|uniref:PucR family transcriptional regulator n=1 Tax=Blautia schinkii TaxID=180164 RepID=UPI0015700298|nr:helix-turn-helix domain-containing protein [Blautia schinkii]NSK34987.1 CdaR family transcriptional regulator [Blautia schinkii]NSK65480.1 CdaR family transcriptional regulator [Blautia schinkii]